MITKKEVNEHLKVSFTPKGVRLWWDRPRWQLDGKTPQEAWDEGRREEVLELAIAGRGMVAT